MAFPFRPKQNRKLKTSTAMVTRPMPISTPVDYAERTGAAFLPTFESLVLVPFSEAIVSGLLVGAAVAAITFILACFAMAYIEWLGWWFVLQSTLVFALLGFFITACVAWFNRDYKDLLWYTEYAQSPTPQQETRQTHEARVKVNSNWVHADLPFDRDNPQALVNFAGAVVAGIASFSELGAGRYGYSVKRFNELRDNLIGGKMAYWKTPGNRRGGVGLSHSGIALLQSVASNPPPPNYEPAEDWGMSPEMVQK